MSRRTIRRRRSITLIYSAAEPPPSPPADGQQDYSSDGRYVPLYSIGA